MTAHRAPALQVERLTISYGAETIVEDLSFEIGAGEIVALVGESGSGKTSTAHAVLGLLGMSADVSVGSIRLGETELSRASETQLRAVRGARLGYVPQDPGTSLNPVKRIAAQVAEVYKVHRIGTRADRAARVAGALREAGIADPDHRARQFPHELSGGLAQRALIAQAIAARPELVVADEPTSALDVTVQKEVLDNLVAATTEHGTAVLLITHDLGVAAERADRILVLRSGRIVEEGDARDVLLRPQHDYTRALVGATPAAIARSVSDRAAAASAVTPIVTVANLRKEFSGARRGRAMSAVDDVSFSIGCGSTFALVGESGSGKTTTARIVARLETATTGSITFHRDDVQQASERELRRHVQFVHQNPLSALDPRFTVAEAIEEPLRAFRIGDRRERRDRMYALLERVALPASLADRTTGRLSGGQAQRVAIARALAPGPSFVILDEAVSALDVSVQAQILDLLMQIREDLGLSYLFISHDLAVVAQISDEVAVMRDGRIVEAGRTGEIFSRPRTSYTQRLLDAVPTI